MNSPTPDPRKPGLHQSEFNTAVLKTANRLGFPEPEVYEQDYLQCLATVSQDLAMELFSVDEKLPPRKVRDYLISGMFLQYLYKKVDESPEAKEILHSDESDEFKLLCLKSLLPDIQDPYLVQYQRKAIEDVLTIIEQNLPPPKKPRSILLDRNGKLVDGSHMIYAIVSSRLDGVPCRVFFTSCESDFNLAAINTAKRLGLPTPRELRPIGSKRMMTCFAEISPEKAGQLLSLSSEVPNKKQIENLMEAVYFTHFFGKIKDSKEAIELIRSEKGYVEKVNSLLEMFGTTKDRVLLSFQRETIASIVDYIYSNIDRSDFGSPQRPLVVTFSTEGELFGGHSLLAAIKKCGVGGVRCKFIFANKRLFNSGKR